MLMTLPIGSGLPGSLIDQNSRGHVSPNLIRGLQEAGYPAPVRSLCDPRLDFPEILLCSGWERYPTDDGVRYEYTVGERCRQEVEYGPGTTRALRTTCYGLRQVLIRYPDGRMEEWHEQDD
jgi:hypothetical protein